MKSSGYLTGAGGDGGATSPEQSNAFPGSNGTSALGIEYAATINNGGVIRCGYGGGGGGSGASNDPSDKSDTDYGRTGGGGGGLVSPLETEVLQIMVVILMDLTLKILTGKESW